MAAIVVIKNCSHCLAAKMTAKKPRSHCIAVMLMAKNLIILPSKYDDCKGPNLSSDCHEDMKTDKVPITDGPVWLNLCC